MQALAVRWTLALGLASLAGCGGSDGGAAADDAGPQLAAWEQPGPHPVGFSVVTGVVDGKTGRTMDVEIWYPADDAARVAASQGTKLEDQVPAGAHHDTLAGLASAAPASCTRKVVGAAQDVTPAGTAWPTVFFSHCAGCARYSSAAIAERLASHGIAVVAPDHQGDTIFDSLAGNAAAISPDFTSIRAGDVRFVADVVLDPAGLALPSALRGRFDAAHVGVMGHSYGGATTGLVLQDDPRFLAGLSFAAPFENPLTGGATMAAIQKPMAFWLAVEDGSITKIGNDLITSNYQAAKAPAWLWSVEGAGHWSMSDLCGIQKSFAPGCAAMQSGNDDFTFLPNDEARSWAGAYALAFFSATLLDDGAARTWLATGPAAAITASAR